MARVDIRAVHLGWVETQIRAKNPDLPSLWLSGEAHYVSEDDLAFVGVMGVDDPDRRRRIRAAARDLLLGLGHAVELVSGRDVFPIVPVRPESGEERRKMLREIDAVGRIAGGS